MSADMNQIALVGRLAKDPELRALASGTSVCELRLAFNTSKKTASGWEDVGNFVNVTVWGNQGEALARNLTKGQRVGIAGRLEIRQFEHNGQKREAAQITADKVQYLDPKQDGAGAQRPASSTPATPPVVSVPAPVQADETIPF